MLWSPLATNQQPDLIWNSSQLLPHCLSYSSHIPFWLALSLLSFSLSSLRLRYSDLPCSEDEKEDPGRKILSIHQTCHLELSPSLCVSILLHSLLLIENWKPTTSLLLTDLPFLSSIFHGPILIIHVFVVCVCACVRVCARARAWARTHTHTQCCLSYTVNVISFKCWHYHRVEQGFIDGWLTCWTVNPVPKVDFWS